MGAIVVRVRNALRQPLNDEIDVFVVSTQTDTTAGTLRSARGQSAIRFERLIEGHPYTVRVFPKRHRPVAQIVTAGSDDKPAEVTLHCPLRPDRVEAVTFPQYADVHPELRRILECSTVDDVAGTGEDMYRALTNTQKAGLFNLFTKMSSVKLANGRSAWSFVNCLFGVREDRVFVDVQPELRELVESSIASDLFDAVSGSLHDPPEGFGHAGSFKTAEAYGNLQLTFFRSAATPATFKVDADIDNAAGLGHAFQVIRNFVTQDATHPYDIHEILVFRQEAALPYELA
jgi:hypothetical protein